MSDSSYPNLVAIKELSTFTSKWQVIGRVVKSDAIKTFPSKTGTPGKVWNILISDELGDVIQGTFWGDSVDKYQKNIEENKTYVFSKGQIKMSNRKYTTCPHPYAITFSNDSVIEEKKDLAFNTVIRYNIEGGLRNVKSSMRELIDCVGVVLNYRPEAEIKTKSGDERVKREFSVCDSSGHKIQVDVWGPKGSLNRLNDDALDGKPVASMRNCRIQEYRGRVLNVKVEDILLTPQAEVDEVTMPQQYEQLEWYRTNSNKMSSLVSITEEYTGSQGTSNNSNVINLDGIVSLNKAHNLMKKTFVVEGNEVADIYFRTLSYPTRYFYQSREDKKLTCFYKACKQCGRKWSAEIGCSSCGERGSEESRFILNLGVADPTGSRLQIRMFGKQGEEIMGISANEFEEMTTRNENYKRHFDWDRVHIPISLRVRAHINHYNGESRLNMTATSVDVLTGQDFLTEAMTLLKDLEQSYPVLLGGSKRLATDLTSQEKRKKIQ